MRQVLDESALEPSNKEGSSCYFVRSLLDPYVLIQSNTGEVFARRDGLRWEHGGYKVVRHLGGKVEWTIGAAYADSSRYPATRKAAA